MTLLGMLLKNRKGRVIHSAWSRPNRQGPELLIVTSEAVGEGQSTPREHAGKRVGGRNLSPDLSWSPPPPETTELVLGAEDLDPEQQIGRAKGRTTVTHINRTP